MEELFSLPTFSFSLKTHKPNFDSVYASSSTFVGCV